MIVNMIYSKRVRSNELPRYDLFLHKLHDCVWDILIELRDVDLVLPVVPIFATFKLLVNELLRQFRRVNCWWNSHQLCNHLELFLKLGPHFLDAAQQALVQHLLLLFVDNGLHLLAVVVFEAAQVLIQQIFHRLVDLCDANFI